MRVLALALLGGCGSPAPEVRVPPELPGTVAFTWEPPEGERRLCFTDGGPLRCPEALAGAFPGPPSPAGDRLAVIVVRDDGGHRERLAIAALDGTLTDLTGWTGRVRAPSWSPDGEALVFASDAAGLSDLWTVRPGSVPVLLDAHPAGDFEPSWGPAVLFASSRDGNAELYRRDPDGTIARLTEALPDDARPVWSPDGRSYAWLSSASGRAHVWIQRPDGPPVPLGASPGEDLDFAWSPDGARIAVTTRGPDGVDLEVRAVDGRVVGRIASEATEEHPAWSRDGAWLAFTCTTDGRSRVCASTWKGRERRVIAEADGSCWLPRWLGPEGG